MWKACFLLGIIIAAVSTCATAITVVEIDSIEELQLIGNDPAYPFDADYVLTQDIDASATVHWNDGAGFEPIAFYWEQFGGQFDGQGHTISGLWINRPDTQYCVGLIAGLGPTGFVANVHLEGGSITGHACVGALVGFNSYGPISSCSSTATVTGDENVGGLVGQNYHGMITSCYATGNVTGSGNWFIGGLVGWNSGSLTECYATGNVTAYASASEGEGEGEAERTRAVTLYSDYVGGLVGDNREYGTATSCYAKGIVRGNQYVGGLMGRNYRGTLTSCYASGSVVGGVNVGGLAGQNFFVGIVTQCFARGAVTGTEKVGGLVGHNYSESGISKSYSTGAVAGSTNVGGLVGYNEGSTVTSSFWNTETSGQATSDGGTASTTALMMQQSTFTDWDFVSTWGIAEGVSYPYLLSIDSGLVLLAPNGGEVWGIGALRNVTWLSYGDPGADVRIGLLKGGVFQDWMKRRTENDGSWTWLVPADLDPDTDYRIRVQSYSRSGLRDDSDACFTVGDLTVISPNGLEEWEMGSIHEIRWAGSGTVVGPDARIGLHDGVTFLDWIVRRTANDGRYLWSIPTGLTPGAAYRVRVQSYADANIRDYSDLPFTLTEAPLVITAPTLNEEWSLGGTYTVTWDCNDMGAVSPNVRIGLHRGGAFVDWLARRTENDGSWDWAVPMGLTPASSYRLRLQSYTDSQIRTISPPFTIATP